MPGDVSTSDVDHHRALEAEYQDVRLGGLWLAEIWAAVRDVVLSYPPAVYSETGVWSEAAMEDVVSDVTVKQLLTDGQLDYVVSTARTLSDVRGLLRHNVKWTIARRRRRTVVDNLLDRCRERRAGVDDAGPSSALSNRRTWRSATDDEIRQAVRRVAQLPRVAVRGGDRAPVVFTTEVLDQVLVLVAESLPGGYGDNDLARILEQVLTPHLPSGLVLYGGVYDEPDESLSPEEVLLVTDLVARVAAALNDEQRVMYAMKLRGDADSTIARHLGLSRPTVASRRASARDVLSQYLIDLPQRLQDAAMMELAHLLLSAYLPSRGGHLPSTDDQSDQSGGAS